MARGAAWIAALALAPAAAGCGGDGGGGEEPEQDETNAALACVQDAGLKAIATAGDEPLGITGALRISLPPDNRITVDFFEDAEQAGTYSDGQAAFLEATGGSSQVVDGTVVIGTARPGAERESARVKGCIG